MRRLVFSVLLVCVTAIGISAQAATREVVAPSGLGVTIPATYAAQVDGNDTITFVAFANEGVINGRVVADAAARDAFNTDATDAAGLLSAYRQATFAQFDSDNLIRQTLANGEALILPYGALFGQGLVVTIDLTGGGVALFELILISDVVTLADDLTPYLTIAESIRVDAEPIAVVDDSGDLPTLDLPAGELRFNEMPPGLIIFPLNVQMPLPDGWSMNESDIVTDTAVLTINAMDGLVTVTIADISGFASYDDWRAASMLFAGAMFAESADASVTLERPDGRTAERFGGGELPILLYFVDLGGNIGALINVLPIMNTDADFIASLRESTDAIALEMTRFNRFSAADEAAAAEREAAMQLQMIEALRFLGTFEATCDSTDTAFMNEEGDSAIYVCPAGCGSSTAWGTDIYTGDSSVCTAAIHAGVLTRDGGAVLVTRIEGQTEYPGSERNGISTSSWGSWGSSFFVGAPAGDDALPEVEPAAAAPAAAIVGTFDVSCSARGDQHVSRVGQAAVYVCPAGCTSGSIWGTDIYTSDSSACIAAIHAGVITPAAGGPVVITYLEGQTSYTGSERNGISTSNYGSWGGSFSVSAPE